MRTMTVLLVVVTLATTVWCLCTRRLAWGALGERPITLAVALQTAAVLMLLPPLSTVISRPLHALTDQWNASGFIGHCLCIASDAAIAYHVAWRAHWEEEFRRGFKIHVELPGTLAIGLMFALWWIGNGSDVPVQCLYLVPLDLSTRLYWLVFCGALAWILVYAVRSMLTLRQDPRSRTVVTIYIAASCSGIAALLLRTVELVPSLNNTVGLAVASVFGCGAIGLFAIGAGYSWARKTRWFWPPHRQHLVSTPKPVKICYSPRTDAPPF